MGWLEMTSIRLQPVNVGLVLAHLGLLLLDTFLHEMPTVTFDLSTLGPKEVPLKPLSRGLVHSF